MKKQATIIFMAFFVGAILSSCGNYVSKEEYDKVVEEKEDLQENYDELLDEYSSYYAEKEVEALKEEVQENNSSDLETNESEKEAPFNYKESGQYKVGKDIEAGEYVLLAESDSGFFSVNSDANGNDIIFNGSFKTNTIVTVKDGEFFEFKRSVAVKYEEFYSSNQINIDNEGIMIKVGNEIQAGEYQVEGEDGYYCIYSDSRQGDIISNGLIDGMGYISVENGQYLELNRCKLKIE